jgi:Flp pilus assembly protein TadG
MTARAHERGSVTVFVTLFTLTLVFVAGLVVDGGQILNARREAANIAESAARAGAQALDEHAARTSGATILNPRQATARARTFLATNGHQGTATATNSTVTVTVTIHQPLLILSLGGLTDVTVVETGTATPLHGIEEATP